MNKAASDLAKQRWAKIPKKERAQYVPRSGGRPRKYPKCPRYKNEAHRFVNDRCPCGFKR